MFGGPRRGPGGRYLRPRLKHPRSGSCSTCESEFTGPRSKVFDPNLSRFDLHGSRGAMQLNTDQTFQLAPGLIVIDELAHHMTVHHLDQGIAARDNMHFIPVAGLDKTLQLHIVAERCDGTRFFTVAHINKLAAQRQKAATPLFIDLAGVALLRIDVRLISLHHPFGDVGALNAAVLNAAVSAVGAGQTIFQLQLEIRRLAIAPDTENILRRLMIGPAFTNNRPVFDAPENRIAIPAFEALAIEDETEAGLFELPDGTLLLRDERDDKGETEDRGGATVYLHISSLTGTNFDPATIRGRFQHCIGHVVG